MLRRMREDLLGRNLWEEFPALSGRGLREVPYEAAESRLRTLRGVLRRRFGHWAENSCLISDGGLVSIFDISERKGPKRHCTRARRFKVLYEDNSSM